MSDFDYECMQRKNLARQSRHRKNGSKSKKCSLPSDKLTHRQWKERCGPIMRYNLNSPMKWENFKKLPGDIQEGYINHLQLKYGATAVDLAKMFGVKALTVRRLVEANGLAVDFPRGHAMSRANRAAWNVFIGVEECAITDESSDEQDVLKHDQSEPEKLVDTHEVFPRDTERVEKVAMNMKKVSLQFDGRINIDMIANSLRLILGNDPVGEMEIVCSLV